MTEELNRVSKRADAALEKVEEETARLAKMLDRLRNERSADTSEE